MAFNMQEQTNNRYHLVTWISTWTHGATMALAVVGFATTCGWAVAQEVAHAVQPNLVWSERIEFVEIGQFEFDASGENLHVTAPAALSFDTDTGARKQLVGSVLRITEDGQNIVQLTSNGEYGEGLRHRLILGGPGVNTSLLDAPELRLGSYPEILSSRNGRAHILVPARGETPDDRPILITDRSQTGIRLELDMAKYPEPVAITSTGLAIVRTRSGLTLFNPDGTATTLLDLPDDNFLIYSSDAGARLTPDEDKLLLQITDPENYKEAALHVIDLEAGGSIAEYSLPILDAGILHSIAFRPEGLRVAFYTYGSDVLRSVLVYDIFEDREAVLVTQLDTSADYTRPVLSLNGNKLAVSTSDNQLELYTYLNMETPAPDASKIPFPTLVVGLGGANTLTDIAISPDNRFLATADYQGQVWLWELASGRAIRSFGLYDSATNYTKLLFSDDGETLMLSADDRILFFDVRSGKLQREYSSTGFPKISFDLVKDGFLICHIRGCIFQPEDNKMHWVDLEVPDYLRGARLCRDHLILYDNGQNGSATMFQMGWTGSDTSEVIIRTDFPDTEITTLACASDGHVFVGTKGGKVMRLDDKGNVVAETIAGGNEVEALEILPGEALLVGRKGSYERAEVPADIVALTLYSLERILETTVPLMPEGSVRHLNFLRLSNDLTRAVTVTQNPGSTDLANANPNHISLWNLADLRTSIAEAKKAVHTLPDEFLIAQGIASGSRKPTGVAFSPDGKKLAVSYRSDSAVWSIETGQVALRLLHRRGNNLKMSDAGMFLLDDSEGPVFVGWDKSVRNLQLPPEMQHDLVMTGMDLIVAGSVVALGADNGTLIWPKGFIGEQSVHFVQTPESSSYSWRSLNPVGDLMLLQSYDRVLVQLSNEPEAPPIWSLTDPEDGSWKLHSTRKAAFSMDGRYVLVPLSEYSSEFAYLALLPETGEIIHRLKRGVQFGSRLLPVRVASDGNAPELLAMLNIGADGFAELLRSPDDLAPGRVNLGGIWPVFATVSYNNRFLAVGGLERGILLWDRNSGTSQMLDADVFPAVAPQHNIAFSPDGTLLALSETDGTVSIFKTENAERVARLLGFADGGWAVIGADGRYDASDPGNNKRLSWVLADDPLYPMPIESYIQEYFEPRLLGRLLAGEHFPDLPPPQTRNRVTPEVKLIDISHPTTEEDGTATVTVAVVIQEALRNGVRSGLRTIKLFRDDQLVAQSEENRLDEDGSVRVLFEGIALPPDVQEVSFSAHAFNDDNIKGLTSTEVYSFSAQPAGQVSRRAIVVAVGINAYGNPAWNLNYAASDAEATASIIGEELRRSNEFEEVIDIALTSRSNNQGEGLATRGFIEAVLRQLAGTATSSDLQISGLPLLPKARPQDLVYIALAGHGLAGDDGVFYFFTQEFGSGLTGRSLPKDLASQSLDSTRLSNLLRGIDARDLVLVIDACNSAASVEGSGFKPGPMGSKGLGQLAYDKSMRVLTASQAEAVALESDTLRHGALTFALVREGLEATQADLEPRNGTISMGELLSFARDRVPDLYLSLREGRFKPLSRGAFNMVIDDPEDIPTVQQPALFDFRRSDRKDIVLGSTE